MLDLVGLLTSPRLFFGALLGLLVGLFVAYVVRSIAGPQVAIEMLALLVAGGIIIGLLVAAWQKPDAKGD